MPEPYPADFSRDVMAVARTSEASVAQVAKDFRMSETCLQRWAKIGDREVGPAPPTAAYDRGGGAKDSGAELRKLRLLKQAFYKWGPIWSASATGTTRT